MANSESPDMWQGQVIHYDIVPLVMPDVNSCLATVLRSVIASNESETATPTPEEIDTLVRRDPGKPVYGRLDLTVLAERGYDVTEITDKDMERWRGEGTDYLKEYYGIHSDEPLMDLDRFEFEYGDHRIAEERRNSVLDFYDRLLASGHYTRENRLPDLDDAIELLSLFGMVTLAITEKQTTPMNLSHAENHLVVVNGYYDADGEDLLEIYIPSPNPDHPSTGFLPRTELAKLFNPRTGIATMWR